MFRPLKIGTPFGIGVYVHWTFWLLPLFIGLATYSTAGLDEALLMLAVVMGVFVCVVLHELGHALMARYYGIGTHDITLYPIGGVARLKRISERPWEEFWISVAGPAVNVVIALGLAGAMLATGLPLGLSYASTPFAEVLVNRLFWVNIGLVVFNMLPAFPMDGGRVLRAILSMVTSRLRATRIAVGMGVVMAGLFVAVGLGMPLLLNEPVSPMLPIIGVFIFLLGQQELEQVRLSEARKAVAPRPQGVMMPIEQILGPNPPEVAPGFSGFMLYPERGLWVEWQDGKPVRVMVVG